MRARSLAACVPFLALTVLSFSTQCIADGGELRPCVAGTLAPVEESLLATVTADPGPQAPDAAGRFNLGYPHRQGELLVFPATGAPTTEAERNSWLALWESVDAKVVGGDRRVPMVRIQLPIQAVLGDRAEKLMLNGGSLIRSIEANSCLFLHQVSTGVVDPDFSSQWGHDRIDVEEAWKTTTGTSSVVVAIIDSGINHQHPDLACNFWNNPCDIINGESDSCGGAGDDDRIDDINGWDFVGEDGLLSDSLPHGTPVAGIIGACRNPMGVVGTNWSVSLMDLRVYDTSGDEGTLYRAISAFAYAVRNGANVVNMSFATGSSKEFFDLINAAPEVMVVASAGDSGGAGRKLDATSAVYPCSWTSSLANLICVTSSDKLPTDAKAPGANYGEVVDIAAPGVDILSTEGTGTGVKSGTSMAAPYASGVLALLRAQYPLAPAGDIIDCALAGDDIPALEGKTAPGSTPSTGRRLNAAKALRCPALTSPVEPP